ncbi:MAG: DUF3021 domain-containing protein [Eubacteriales bacterium]|nr:DUF3021 domain-containing protein [Eubacteriales bacterium]
MKRKFRDILSREIAIEYKACLYFCCILAFYFLWLVCRGIYEAHILYMFEMVMTAYAAGYLQVYALRNFDEAEQIGRREVFSALLCTCLYAAASYGMGWFGKTPWLTAAFGGYIFFCYFCVYLCNKVKRRIDTEKLNDLLAMYKKGEPHE